jgi:hypothetical protein
MSATKSRHSLQVRLGLFACILPVFAGACGGIAPDAVRTSTSAITAQVALAKAALVSCRGGDHAQCDSAQQNLEAIASTNSQLDHLAEQ